MDLISRQAALDAIGEIHPLDYNAQAIAEKIKGLPSTHPLDPCETCVHKGKGWDEEPCDGCTQNDNKYEPNNGWIPVGRAMTKWLERNGFIPIPTRSLTDDEIQALKSIMGEPLEEEERCGKDH